MIVAIMAFNLMVNFLVASVRRGWAPSLPATWPPCALPLGWRAGPRARC